MKEDDFVSVSIPKDLFARISREIGNTSSKAVSKYVTYIVKRELSSEKGKAHSDEDKEKIRETLRKLGYF